MEVRSVAARADNLNPTCRDKFPRLLLLKLRLSAFQGRKHAELQGFKETCSVSEGILAIRQVRRKLIPHLRFGFPVNA